MTCRVVHDNALVLPIALVGDEVERLRPALLRAVREATNPVVELNAQYVELISSSGLGLLVAAAMLAREQGKSLEVRRASELFRQSIALTGLARHLGMTPEPAGID